MGIEVLAEDIRLHHPAPGMRNYLKGHGLFSLRGRGKVLNGGGKDYVTKNEALSSLTEVLKAQWKGIEEAT